MAAFPPPDKASLSTFVQAETKSLQKPVLYMREIQEEQTVTDDVAENTTPSIWAEVVDAIKGSEADYTKISLKRAIFLLAVPMILELVMESTFAIADIYFVGKLGPSAV